jgi:hypothetical protein
MLEYVPTLGFQVVQVATPAVTVWELQPLIELEPFLKLTVPVAVFELAVAVNVLAAPYTTDEFCVVKDVVEEEGKVYL